MSFPVSPTTGQVVTINGITYVYNSSTTSWTRTSLSLPTFTVLVDTFVSNGSTTSYTLSATPTAKEYVTVNIDGVLQQKTAYSVSGSTITLTGTPINGAVIEVRTTNATTASILTGLVYDTFTGDGVASQYNLSTSPATKNHTIISINGVVQAKSAYSITSSSLILNSTPALNALIEVTTFGPAISASGSIASGSNTQVQFNTNGSLAASSNFTFDSTANTLSVTTLSANTVTSNSASVTGNITVTGDLYVGNGASSTSFTNPVAIFKDTGLTYVQTAVVNSNGNGSADITAYGNNGDDMQSWVDIGFTGNTFNDANYTVTSAGDGYLFAQGNTSFGGNLVIATGNIGTTKDIVFATGGFQTGNVKARLYNSNGAFSVNGTVIGGNLYTAGTLTVNGMASFQLTADMISSLSGATGTVTHDMATGAVFYHTNPSANWTANFTNVPTTDGRALMATLVVSQGSTGYYPNAVQINGSAQTIKWVGGSAPTPNANKIDVFAISMLRISGAWVVMAQSATYS